MISLAEQLQIRKKIIEDSSTELPNYFNLRNYFEFDKFLNYIFITPRSIGKTFSGFDVAFEAYELTGEFTVWMRTSFEEIKEIVDDYKRNPPHWKLKGEDSRYEWSGKSIIDKETGLIVIKFIALSTVGNVASITGNGCWLLIYDEFLPRSTRRLPNSFHKITDFIKTIERGSSIITCLLANSTTLNSDILMQWDIWNDIDEVDNLELKMRYRRFTTWENPPKIKDNSNASIWASRDPEMLEFMDNAKFKDGDDGMVIPESRLGNLRYFYQFKLNNRVFTMGMTDDDVWVALPSQRMEGIVYSLTTEDGLVRGSHVRPQDIEGLISPFYYALENDNLVFTDFTLKDEFIEYLTKIYGKIQKVRD